MAEIYVGLGETSDPNDPKGLIREAFRIEGITLEECRSIFLDWALSLPEGIDAKGAAAGLLAAAPLGHPMTEILKGVSDAEVPPQRRGGRAARLAKGK